MDLERDHFDYMSELFKLACKYNADDFHVFCDLSGHINQIEIKVFCGGWEVDRKPCLLKTLYIENERSYQEIGAREAILALTRLHRLYRKHGITNISKVA